MGPWWAKGWLDPGNEPGAALERVGPEEEQDHPRLLRLVPDYQGRLPIDPGNVLGAWHQGGGPGAATRFHDWHERCARGPAPGVGPGSERQGSGLGPSGR